MNFVWNVFYLILISFTVFDLDAKDIFSSCPEIECILSTKVINDTRKNSLKLIKKRTFTFLDKTYTATAILGESSSVVYKGEGECLEEIIIKSQAYDNWDINWDMSYLYESLVSEFYTINKIDVPTVLGYQINLEQPGFIIKKYFHGLTINEIEHLLQQKLPKEEFDKGKNFFRQTLKNTQEKVDQVHKGFDTWLSKKYPSERETLSKYWATSKLVQSGDSLSNNFIWRGFDKGWVLFDP